MNKTILLSLLFIIPIIFLGASEFKGGDYSFHYAKSHEGCGSDFFTDLNRPACESYTPLYHWLSSLFTFTDNAFFYLSIFIFLILTPLVLFYYTKNWFATLVYFSASNYVYYFMDGIFAQGIAHILLLILLYTKDNRIEIGILPLLILSHGAAFLAGIVILVFKKIDLNGWLCSSVFANQKPEVLYAKIGSSGGIDFAVNNILHFFLKAFPFPYMIMAFKEAYDSDKRIFALFLILIPMGYFHAARVWYLLFLLAIPMISQFYLKQSKRMKIALILMTLIIGCVQFYLFWNFKNVC